LLAASDVTVDALFREAGVVRTDTLDEMLHVADVLVHQPLPGGPRVAIVSNAGGPAVMCADTCEAHGLQVAPLSDTTQARLRQLLPVEASVVNPVDMLAAATAENYGNVVRVVAEDPNVDSVITIFLPPLVTRPDEVARSLVAAADATGNSKPVLAVFMSTGNVPDLASATGRRLAGYHMPEPAAIALAHATRYAAWRARPAEALPVIEGVQRGEAALLVADALQRGGGWIPPGDVRRLLTLYGLPTLEQRVINTPQDAAVAADEMGGEVAMKVIAPGVVHKSDVGGVKLHLEGQHAARRAAEAIVDSVRRALDQEPSGFIVQRMAPTGVEMLVGMVNDPQFGPTIACGAGGTLVELQKDVSVRLSPLTRGEAASMLRELRTFPLLTGYRGAEPCDVAALEDVLLRVSALAEDHPNIAELDCNPVIMCATGAVVVDARVRVESAAPRRPLGARL
jgi:acetate---CoA ligase (ADP-forming)